MQGVKGHGTALAHKHHGLEGMDAGRIFEGLCRFPDTQPAMPDMQRGAGFHEYKNAVVIRVELAWRLPDAFAGHKNMMAVRKRQRCGVALSGLRIAH